MSDRLSLGLGVFLACASLALLVDLDVPVIEGGGVDAGFAALELLLALGVIVAALAHAGRG